MVQALRNLARLRLEVYLQVREPPLHSQWSHLKQQEEMAVLVDPLVSQAGLVLIEEPGKR